MTHASVGFIGSGRVTKIILNGWARANALPHHVLLFDPNRAASEALTGIGAGIEVCDDASESAAQDVVFLAVHPPVFSEALSSIASSLRANAILVSLAPKFTIAKIAGILNGFKRVARVIPNAPSIVGHGYNPVSFGPALSRDDLECIRGLFASLGISPEVDEHNLEAYAILAAMGPTYFWPQLAELIVLGETFGLSRDATQIAIDRMVEGALATMNKSGLDPEGVMDLIPVKPMAEEVSTLVSAYRVKLTGLMEKI